MRAAEQQRYEAIYRAIGRLVRNGLFLCIGTSVLVAFAFGVSSALLAPVFPADWPRWLVFLVLMLPFGVAVTVIPNLAQLLVIRGRNAKAIEALNVFGLGEAEEFTAMTGKKPPVILSADRARRWLKRGEGFGTRLRIRFLIWAGELSAAAETIANLRVSNAADAFHQALLRQLVEYVATGSMDLTESRAALERIPPSPARDHAIVTLAFEEARLDLDNGADYLKRLAGARDQLTELPRGASIRDRFTSSIPSSIGTFAVIATIIWVVAWS